MSRSVLQATPGTLRRRPRILGFVNRAGIVLLLLLGALFFVGPFAWTVASSFKSWIEIYNFPPTFFPEQAVWENYVLIFSEVPFARWFMNSTLIAILSVLGAILSSSLVGYAFARFRFPGRDILFMSFMATIMLPSEVTLIPQYVLFAKLHWIDTYKPLIVPLWFGGGVFNIFFMRQYFMTLPRELDEAAMIDGAGPFRIFWNVLLPLCVPVLVTMTVLGFIASWNNFMGPLIYLNSMEKLTVPIALQWFRGQSATQVAYKPTEGLMMAAATVATIPCILLFIVAQRYFVRGVVMSGLKGAGV